MFVSTRVRLATGEEATVYYLSEEGKKRFEQLLSNVSWTDKRIDTAFERINGMHDELVRNLFLDKLIAFILERLKNGELTQQNIARDLPDFTKNTLIYHAFYDAWKQLEKNYVIIPISHGRGHPRTWKISIQLEEIEAK